MPPNARAHAAIFFKNRERFVFERRNNLRDGMLRINKACSYLAATFHRPAQIDRGRTRFSKMLARGVELLQPGGSRCIGFHFASGQHRAERARASDRRSAAHRQPQDRFFQLSDAVDVEICLRNRKLRLVQQAKHAAVP